MGPGFYPGAYYSVYMAGIGEEVRVGGKYPEDTVCIGDALARDCAVPFHTKHFSKLEYVLEPTNAQA